MAQTKPLKPLNHLVRLNALLVPREVGKIGITSLDKAPQISNNLEVKQFTALRTSFAFQLPFTKKLLHLGIQSSHR